MIRSGHARPAEHALEPLKQRRLPDEGAVRPTLADTARAAMLEIPRTRSCRGSSGESLRPAPEPERHRAIELATARDDPIESLEGNRTEMLAPREAGKKLKPTRQLERSGCPAASSGSR